MEEAAYLDEEYLDKELVEEPRVQTLKETTEVKHRERIKWWVGWMLITSALVLDIIELLLTDLLITAWVPIILSAAASAVYWIFFHVLEVPYTSNTKRYAVALITNIGEFLPFDVAQIWFLWTVGMIIIVGMVRMEDKGEEPGIIGGFMEGIGLFTQNPVAAITMPVLSVVSYGANRARRTYKQRSGGEANWVKEKKIDQQLKNEMITKPGRVGEMRETSQNILDLKKSPGGNKTP